MTYHTQLETTSHWHVVVMKLSLGTVQPKPAHVMVVIYIAGNVIPVLILVEDLTVKEGVYVLEE